MKRIQRLAALTLAGGFFLAGAGLTTASAQWRTATRDRNWALRGDRLDTLRALARYLDDGAQYALAEAGRSVQYSRNGNDRAFLNDLRNFARRTADLTNCRAMAGEVDQRLGRVTDMAERNYNARPGNSVVSELRSLAYQASALYDRMRGSSLDVRDAAPIVERMLADVRTFYRSGIREAVGSDGWNDWQSAMSILQRMDDMIRR